MDDFTILDVVKTFYKYQCESNEALLEKGFAHANFEATLKESKDNNEIKLAEVNFKLLLNSFKIEIEEFKKTDENNVDASLEITFNMIFKTNINIEDLQEKSVMFYLDPFIRKEVLVFCAEIGIPNIHLPHEFWKKENGKEN